jgi:hypothetical protein
MSHANPTSTNEVESSVVTSNSATRTPQGDAASNDSGIRLLLVRMLYSTYWPVGRRGFGNLLVLAWQKHHQSLASHQQTRPRNSLKCRIQPTPTRRDSHSYPKTKRRAVFADAHPHLPDTVSQTEQIIGRFFSLFCAHIPQVIANPCHIICVVPNNRSNPRSSPYQRDRSRIRSHID